MMSLFISFNIGNSEKLHIQRVNEFNRSLWKGIRDVNEDYQV